MCHIVLVLLTLVRLPWHAVCAVRMIAGSLRRAARVCSISRSPSSGNAKGEPVSGRPSLGVEPETPTQSQPPPDGVGPVPAVDEPVCLLQAEAVQCYCGLLPRLWHVKRNSQNRGRPFYRCSNPIGEQCAFFRWGDGPAGTPTGSEYTDENHERVPPKGCGSEPASDSRQTHMVYAKRNTSQSQSANQAGGQTGANPDPQPST